MPSKAESLSTSAIEIHVPIRPGSLRATFVRLLLGWIWNRLVTHDEIAKAIQYELGDAVPPTNNNIRQRVHQVNESLLRPAGLNARSRHGHKGYRVTER